MSTADVIQLIALVLGVELAAMGIVAGFVVPIYLARTRTLKKELAQVSVNSQRQGIMVGILTRALTHFATRDEVLCGMIHRLLIKTGSGEQLPGVDGEMRKMEFEISKDIQELMLQHPDRTFQESACRQLSQVLGDYETLEMMRDVDRLSPGDETLSGAIAQLRARLTV